MCIVAEINARERESGKVTKYSTKSKFLPTIGTSPLHCAMVTGRLSELVGRPRNAIFWSSLALLICREWFLRQNGFLWFICWFAFHRDAGPLTGSPGLSQGGWASHRKVGPLTETLGLKQGGWASHREVRLLTRRPGLLQGGRASYREARPLTGWPGLSQCFITCQKY